MARYKTSPNNIGTAGTSRIYPAGTSQSKFAAHMARNKSKYMTGAGVVGVLGLVTGMAFLPGAAVDAVGDSLFGWLPEEHRGTAMTVSSVCSCCCCSFCIVAIVGMVLMSKS